MSKPLNFKLILMISLSWVFISNAQTTLTHNCGPLIKTTNHSCSYTSQIYWARDFVLSDYGIDSSENLILTQGEVGISYTTRSEEHTSELQSRENLVCRLLLEKKN